MDMVPVYPAARNLCAASTFTTRACSLRVLNCVKRPRGTARLRSRAPGIGFFANVVSFEKPAPPERMRSGFSFRHTPLVGSSSKAAKYITQPVRVLYSCLGACELNL